VRDSPERIVSHFLSFLFGGVLALLCTLRWLGPRRRRAVIVLPPQIELPEIAVGVGAELANLATGIEGNAQLLCEAISQQQAAEPHAEQLCAVVRRLRTLTETIQWTVGPADLRRLGVRIEDVIASVQQELEANSCGRFQLAVDTASSVPGVHTDPRALRQAMLLLVEVLFGKEPAAGKLTLRTCNSLDDAVHDVIVEMTVECEEEVEPKVAVRTHASQLALAHQAASNLLAALGVPWALHVDRGVGATATINLPAADDTDAPLALPATPPSARHEFGGALVLESDPAVRYIIGQELERTGRQVFLCADGVAARTLWRATPERFELLVVEAQGGRAPGEGLAVAALAQDSRVSIVLLGRTELPALQRALVAPHARVAVVPQPFGLMELRDALAHVGIEPSKVAP
jgi:CheY-like chemotaxis protein